MTPIHQGMITFDEPRLIHCFSHFWRLAGNSSSLRPTEKTSLQHAGELTHVGGLHCLEYCISDYHHPPTNEIHYPSDSLKSPHLQGDRSVSGLWSTIPSVMDLLAGDHALSKTERRLLAARTSIYESWWVTTCMRLLRHTPSTPTHPQSGQAPTRDWI